MTIQRLQQFYGITVFLIVISVALTFVPNVLFQGGRYTKYAAAFVLVFAFLFLDEVLTRTRFRVNRTQFFLFAVIALVLGVDIIYRLFVRPDTALRAVFLITLYAALLIFFLKLIALSGRNAAAQPPLQEQLRVLTVPYTAMCSLIVALSCLTFLLIALGAINPVDYPIPSSFGYEFVDRMENNPAEFQGIPELLFPGYLSVTGTYLRLAQFDIPVTMLGWSYEPHVATFLITPSLFFLDQVFNGKAIRRVFIVLYFAFFLMATSMSNFLGLAFVLGLYILRTGRVVQVGRVLLMLALASFLIVYSSIGLEVIITLFEQFFLFVDNKLLNPIGHSSATTFGYWSYVFSAKTPFGTGPLFIPTLDEIAQYDAGLITVMYVVTLYSVGALVLAKLLLSRDLGKLPFTLAWGYCFFHSAKLPLQVINYPYFFFMLFIASYVAFVRIQRSHTASPSSALLNR